MIISVEKIKKWKNKGFLKAVFLVNYQKYMFETKKEAAQKGNLIMYKE